MIEGKTNRGLVYSAPHEIAIQSEPLRPLEAGEARLRVGYSAISRGTERLVFEGRVPPSEYPRMRAPFQRGDFPFPVAYGYAAAGVVEDGPAEWVGRRAFALAPHHLFFIGPAASLVSIPDETPLRRAVLAANLETAVNGLWDGGLGLGDRVAVVGGGVLGAMVAALATRTPGVETLVVDVAPERRATAEAFGARFATPEAAMGFEADLVLHTSATGAGLATALALAGDEATVVELSWHGDGRPTVPLGEAFHSRRLRLISSQVGRVPPDRRARWPNARRLDLALRFLKDPAFDALIDREIALDDAPSALPTVFAPGAPGLATVIRYPSDAALAAKARGAG